MFKTRPCGCKGLRSCLICEEKHGAYQLTSLSDEDKSSSYVFCYLCGNLAYPGWEVKNVINAHPNHQDEPVKFEGVKLYEEFVSVDEEAELIDKLDEIPWDPSQSGRLKQNYGPKCNFKKRKVKVETFDGYPECTKFIQDRFQSLKILENFQTVEQCSLEYIPERGASIDPHIDDCWIWGERIPTLSMLSDSVLTLFQYQGPSTRYNLQDCLQYPSVINNNEHPKTDTDLEKDYKEENFMNICDKKPKLSIIRLPMPQRSLLVFYGEPRYNWEHGILREDITSRRVCITYRELTPTYLPCGPKHEIGSEIIEAGKRFWNHREKYQGIK